ncbi:sugar transferase [Peribacillus glennii]
MKNEHVRKYYDVLERQKTSLIIKRLFDIVFSLLILIVLLFPVFLIICIMIKLDSKGPIMFRQVRITQYGREFRIMKFRTMVNNAENLGTHVTVNNDNRVTKVGKILRKYRLDEIPQLFNILSGDMSFVGTRPEVVKYVEKYTDSMRATLLLPAGLTSEASIVYKDEEKLLTNVADIDKAYLEEVLPQKMEFNLRSIEEFNFPGEIKMLVRTIIAVGRKDSNSKTTSQIAAAMAETNLTRLSRMIDKTSNNLAVSVVMPVYNEENYIEGCISSLIKQDFPKDSMEWLFVDGYSKDNTKQILENYKQKFPNLIKILDNPHRTVPYAMNIGIKEAVGKYIIRLDAHAEYAIDYISKCVHYLETTDAQNVGGVAITKSRGFVGNAIALMLSSKFGVGNSQFRTNGKSGSVDTVPFGAFRREVFEKYGLFDERLTRNEDNELNYRIRKNGGKIYLADDIKLAYYCRDSIKGIVDMAVKNGKWNVIASRLCPGAMGIRHFIPFLFLLSLIILPVLTIKIPVFGWLLAAELGLYLLLNIVFSIKAASEAKFVPLLIILFPVFHISYGFGSLIGLVRGVK